MAELKIEAQEVYLEYGATLHTKLNPVNVEIKIFDGDEVVAETTLDAMVKKFIVISTQYMQALEIIAKVTEAQDAQNAKSKIILPGDA